MNIVFAGGGTGGHVYPALAVAEALKKGYDTDAEILFIGGVRGIERKIIGDSGYPFETIPVEGLPRKVSAKMLTFPWNLGFSIGRCLSILRRFRPAVLAATGGYVAGPPMIAARLLGIPIVIQEQNAFPGITNRYLARFADMIFAGFEEAAERFGDAARIQVSGNPVRADVGAANRAEAAKAFRLDPAIKTLLIFGGSQGARAINKALDDVVKDIADRGFQVLWQTGMNNYDLYSRHDSERVRVVPYIERMQDAYACADLAVARAGAMSIAELTVAGLPAVFIPLPTAAENHQEFNARALMNEGAAEMILEHELTAELLLGKVVEILDDDERLLSMSEASQSHGKPDAADQIAKTIWDRYAPKREGTL